MSEGRCRRIALQVSEFSERQAGLLTVNLPNVKAVFVWPKAQFNIKLESRSGAIQVRNREPVGHPGEHFAGRTSVEWVIR